MEGGKAAYRGYDDQGIAEEAGFSTGVLAHYFENKDALILHALHVSIERMVERMERLGGKLTVLEVLWAVLCEALPLNEEQREEFRTLIGFWGRAVNNGRPTAQQNCWYALWRGVVQALTRRASGAGRYARTSTPGEKRTS